MKKLKKWQKIVGVVLIVILLAIGGFFIFRKQIGDLVLTDEEKVILHFYNDAEEFIKRTGVDAELYDIVYYGETEVYNSGEKFKFTEPDGTLVCEVKDRYEYIFCAYYVYDDKESSEQYNFTSFNEHLFYSVDYEDKYSNIELSWFEARSSVPKIENNIRGIDWDFLEKNSHYKVDMNDLDSSNYYSYHIRLIENRDLETEIQDFKGDNYGSGTFKNKRETVNYPSGQLRRDGNISFLKIKLFSNHLF